MNQDSRKKQSAFTLIELMISMSIIAILSVFLSISFSSAQKNGRDQRRIADLKAIQSAAEQYYLLRGSYPISGYWDIDDSWSVNGQVVLNRFPEDPQYDSIGTTYAITRVNASGNAYCVCADVENNKNGNGEADCNFSNNDYFCVMNQQ
jgi:prepilin-type N-terminal cleavage/methylation domain-containing protein